MQHTDKYQLNLIEASDTFSPEALNENAQKLEQAISAEAAAEQQARAADVAALDQRVSALELHKYVTGYASTTGFTDLGFTPIALIASSSNGHAFVTREQGITAINIVEGGFNHNGYFGVCRYIAFL